jgi:hypothetical protein
MSRDDPNVRLRHMLDYSREAVGLLRDRKRADLDSDRTLGLAILRCVEIVGEAASRSVIKISSGRKLLACVIDSFTGMTSWITISSGARSPKICRR